MKQHSIHKEMIKQVAKKLGPLRSEVVFLGGSATGFHITDKAEPEVRATVDVDVIFEAASLVDYHKFEERIIALGFSQKIQEEDPICRWHIDDIVVDFMPTDEKILGFSNRWYKPAIINSKTVKLESNFEIRLVTAPYFLATKLEAFLGRGKKDYIVSHDLEDIIVLINGRVEIVDDIKSSQKDLIEFITNSFQEFLDDERFHEALPGLLLPDNASQGRRSIILQRIRNIVELGRN
jgi:hypothetical protein